MLMEWVENYLNEIGIEDENKIEEAVELFKSEYFPKNAVPNDEYKKKSSKVEELESELDTAKEQLEQTNQQLDELSDKAEGKEELKNNLEQIKSEYEEYKEQEEQRLQQIKKKSTLEKQLLKSKANEDAVDLLINDFSLDELQLDEEGNLANFDEHLEQVKEKRPTLFGEVEISGNEPQDGETNDANSFAAKYKKAVDNGNRREAIKIKQQAHREGESIG